ncbi:hypothetical protein [Candidatus Uabimicrobium sp. HlEnr_7]|uniref:hypothetical protein n=1 Tax=Candidatus Uabimicrobium helgolandensis TaxID=3095367 RepID=UPI003556D510
MIRTYSFLIFSFLLSVVYSSEHKVNVYLHNGQMFSGTIKEDKFVEVFRSGYETASQQNSEIKQLLLKQKKYVTQQQKLPRSSGLRLWYVNHSNGYVFLPYKNIHEIVWISKAQNVKEKVENKTQKLKEQFNARLKKKIIEEKRLEKERQKKIATQEPDKKEKELLRLSKEEKEILEEFPPGPEWNFEERAKIHKQLNFTRNNFTVRNINGRRVIQKNRFAGVNKKERTFYKKYDLWTKALEKKTKIEQQKKKQQQLELPLEKEKAAPREQQDEVDLSKQKY